MRGGGEEECGGVEDGWGREELAGERERWRVGPHL